ASRGRAVRGARWFARGDAASPRRTERVRATDVGHRPARPEPERRQPGEGALLARRLADRDDAGLTALADVDPGGRHETPEEVGLALGHLRPDGPLCEVEAHGLTVPRSDAAGEDDRRRETDRCPARPAARSAATARHGGGRCEIRADGGPPRAGPASSHARVADFPATAREPGAVYRLHAGGSPTHRASEAGAEHRPPHRTPGLKDRARAGITDPRSRNAERRSVAPYPEEEEEGAWRCDGGCGSSPRRWRSRSRPRGAPRCGRKRCTGRRTCSLR